MFLVTKHVHRHCLIEQQTVMGAGWGLLSALYKRHLGLREVTSQGHQPIYVRAGT